MLVGIRSDRTAALRCLDGDEFIEEKAACVVDVVASDALTALVAAAVEEQSAKIGEKLVLNRFGVLHGTVAVYLHRKSPDLPPQVGVLVEYTGKQDETAEADARAIGMQIAAMRPRYLSRDEVPADIVESERRIAEQTAREEGKPEAALSKIVEGRVGAFFKDFVLLEQASVQEQKKSVQQVLKEAGITVTRFIRFEVGRA